MKKHWWIFISVNIGFIAIIVLVLTTCSPYAYGSSIAGDSFKQAFLILLGSLLGVFNIIYLLVWGIRRLLRARRK